MRILIAVYGSMYDEAAVALGAQVARRARVAPTLLAVASNRDKADQLVARARDVLTRDRSDAETEIATGPVVDRTLRMARQGGYELIVLGEGGESHTVLRRWQEPVGVRLVKEAPCPVLVAKGQARQIRRILLCDSGAGNPAISPFANGEGGTAGSATPLRRFATRLVELLAGDEEVTVLHVMSQMSASPGVRGKQLRANAQELIEEHTPEGELLEADVQMLTLPGVQCYPAVRHGLVVDEIVAQARDGDHDLVMIGAHRGPGWQRLLLDDLASDIVRQVDRPVLVV
ncbi:MAG TPA: universal stress protein [Anaerolineae bacterium]|nr:universal stress protein [Anaerolineae bacterium]